MDDFRPLEPRNFSFYGFDDIPGSASAVDERIRKLGLRSREPAVEIVEGGVFVPASRSTTGSVINEGGILDEHGTPVETVRIRRPRGQILLGISESTHVSPKNQLGEEVIYLGWLFNQFGHFLLESLARTWFLKEVPPTVRVVFHRTGPPIKQGIIRDMLMLFGIPWSRVLFLEAPTRIRRIFIPEPLYQLSEHAHVRAAEPYRDVARRVLEQRGSRASPQHAYISRRLLPSQLRRIVGERELEAILQENGFLIVHPELLPLVEQVRFFNAHSEYIAAEGSAVHNVLYSLNAPKLHILTNGPPYPDYFLVPSVSEAEASFVHCLKLEDRAGAARNSPRILNLPLLLEYLSEKGFLKKQLRSKITLGNLGYLEGQFKEESLFSYVRKSTIRGIFLSTEEEHEAEDFGKHSWPLSLALADYYYCKEDISKARKMAIQFANLIRLEQDIERLAQFYEDIEAVIKSVSVQFDAECKEIITRVLLERFAIEGVKDASNPA